MGITGAWALKARVDYTGATKWGTGNNPVHEVRDVGRGRQIGTRENLLPLGEPGDVMSPYMTAGDSDYCIEDYAHPPVPGEHFRYQDERPRWDKTTFQFRDDVYNPAMGEWVPWGVYNDDNPVDGFPLPGPTGGMDVALDVDHGEREERQHAIAVPTEPVSGGWLNKARSTVATPFAQEVTGTPKAQWAVGTGAVQGPGLKELANERAVARGTDTARSSIVSRTAAMVEKVYAKSWRMGGGTGVPDMFPYQQTAGLKRPFITRAPALPPDEVHFMNTLERRSPFQRATPADPYQGDPETGAGIDDTADWGY